MSETIRKPWLLVVTIGLGTLLNPLNSSMISVALTRLQHEFDLTFASVSWLISTFYLASAVGQPIMGKLSDMFGPKRMFLAGLIIICLASILAPFSPNFGWLIVFRMLQAIGSSTLFPSGMLMIRQSISKNRARALSILSIFSSTSAAFGPSIGGFLINFGDWPAIFFINFPFIIASFISAIFILPRDGRVKLDLRRIDFIGIILFIISIVMILLFLLSFEGPIHWWTLAVAVISSLLFYFQEKRPKEPFIDFKALKTNINLSFVYLQFICINLIFYSIFFGMPSFLQQAQHFSEKSTGVIMLSIAGFGVIIAPFAGRWIDKKGSKPPLLVGALTVIIGTILLLTIHVASPVWWMFLVLSILGISNGFNNIGMQTALYAFARPEETGSASGLFQTSRYIGTILSSVLLALFFNKHMDGAHLHIITIICLIVSVIILLLTIRMPAKKRDTSR
ncbi:MFS transporter [Scopulibacillus cellulosilyticus]|uniref:MFS transporter n=1 Tax=Scopulibacillus cellulosilyticus TaxID=2665665 RepID=A0ABW2PTX8_9BACL